MKLVTAFAFALASCLGDDELETGVLESEGHTLQGHTLQGHTLQGTALDGTGLTHTSLSGATYGSKATTTTLSGTSFRAQIIRSDGKLETRTPTQWCRPGTLGQICTTYNLSSQASPLAGMRFTGTFVRSDGTTFTSTLQIGTSTTQVGAVRNDSSTQAMFPLHGTSAESCQLVGCDNPHGCRVNCNLYTYDVRVLSAGSWTSICPAGERAIAVPGVYSATGQYTTPSGRFTFACTNGTVAKCTRWGYRSWESARQCSGTGCESVTTTPTPLRDYHASCVRAAMADYCGNGHSFTLDGTLVDIYDFQPHQPTAKGFIPRTLSTEQSATAYVLESGFDKYGATFLDFHRYDELAMSSELGSVVDQCPNRFEAPTAPVGDGDGVLEGDEVHQPYDRISPSTQARGVSIDATTVCSHSEQTLGKWLHPTCSTCTYRIWDMAGPSFQHCVRADGNWDINCKTLATSGFCSSSQRMASHSECSTGGALYKHDTACTIRVCSARASCCSSTWDSTCVATANSTCQGGREGFVFPDQLGFCGTALPPINQ